MRIVIFGSGNLHKSFLKHIRKNDYIVGVDRGAYWLIQNKIIPDMAMGDFDSVNEQELEAVKRRPRNMEQYPAEKDKTDLELAIIHALSKKPREVIIFGALGSRIDHTLVAIHLLDKCLQANVFAQIRNEKNIIFLENKKRVIKRDARFKYVSILPATGKILLTLRGFKYSLEKTVIKRGSSLGLSNEIYSDSAVIDIHEGVAVIVICDES